MPPSICRSNHSPQIHHHVSRRPPIIPQKIHRQERRPSILSRQPSCPRESQLTISSRFKRSFTMSSRMGPRSVKDATRFTSTIPHATSKTASAAPAGRPSASAAPNPSPRIPGETPEQRVQRLRRAHIAAQKAQVSRTDRVVDVSRRFLDVAHRWTVGGIVVFTGMLPPMKSGAVHSKHGISP